MPSPRAGRWPRRPAHDVDSQTGGMIQEHPGQVELLRYVLSKRLYSNRFGRVMARIEHVDAELLGVEKGPMLPFTRHECVEPGRRGLRDDRSARARHDSDALHSLRPEREDAWRGAQCLGAAQLSSSRVPLYSPHTPAGAP